MTEKKMSIDALIDRFEKAVGDLNYSPYDDDYRAEFAAARAAIKEAFVRLEENQVPMYEQLDGVTGRPVRVSAVTVIDQLNTEIALLRSQIGAA